MSQMFLQFPFVLLVVAFALMMLQAHAQDQSGFISIDCGQQTREYKEPTTEIAYITDTNLIDTGVGKVVSMSDPRPQFRFLRIFREGTRNCYKINNINRGQKYLIRASFVFGDYDREEVLPEFELHLGTSLWDSVVITNASAEVIKELIHVPIRNYIHVCLIYTGKGFPFISTIELRPLHKNTYPTEKGSLALYLRRNLAANRTRCRYPEDVNDRIWYPQSMPENWKELNTSSNIDQTNYQLPSRVMSTAFTPKDISTKYLGISATRLANATYHIYLHLAEVESLNASLSRPLAIYINKNLSYRAFYPLYLKPRTYISTIAVEGGQFDFWIYSPRTISSYGPILNAYEIYMEKKFLESETDEQDVEAITKLKSTYGIIKNWQGDPCYPQEYRWEGVHCSYSDHDSARIISLNLSSSGLAGDIADSIVNLTMLQTLDLSNNKLSEQIPEYLSQLQKLHILNLEKNELKGSIPAGLIEKKNYGLSLSLCGNPSLLSGQLPCEKKKKNPFVIPVVVLIVVVSWVASAAAILRKSKRFLAVCESLGYGKLCKVACTESETEQKRRGHDVFLSFRGEDTRTGFARNLHNALDQNRIKTFFDDQNLQKGDEIGPTLLNAIEASEISIILFSETYVSSSWCLSELVKILECKRKKDQRIVPVFYKVNPTDTRHQSGSFSLEMWTGKRDTDVPVWKEALGEVANLSGYHYTDGYEIDFIGKIVKDISDVMPSVRHDMPSRWRR